MKSVEFIKMHGAGNDYVYLDCVRHTLPENPESLAVAISDRHFGVGGDGLVCILPSEVADFRMRIWNADGSEAQMCGNASRCVGKYLFDSGLTDKHVVTLETLAGIKVLHLTLDSEGRHVESVTVDMGEPALCDSLIDDIDLEGNHYLVTRVSMGNPHAVCFLDHDPGDELVLGVGPHLEVNPLFPEKANIEFAHVLDRRNINMRVWERGSGETLACGTGSCATAVAAAVRGLTDREVTIHLRGGDLMIRWDETDNHVYMSGPAAIVAEGKYYL